MTSSEKVITLPSTLDRLLLPSKIIDCREHLLAYQSASIRVDWPTLFFVASDIDIRHHATPQYLYAESPRVQRRRAPAVRHPIPIVGRTKKSPSRAWAPKLCEVNSGSSRSRNSADLQGKKGIRMFGPTHAASTRQTVLSCLKPSTPCIAGTRMRPSALLIFKMLAVLKTSSIASGLTADGRYKSLSLHKSCASMWENTGLT